MSLTKKEIKELSITSGYNVATGTNAYSVTIPEVRAYNTGLKLQIKFTNANTGASNINVNGLGVKTIFKLGNVALASGDIAANSVTSLVYDGTNFQVVGFRLLPNSPNKVITTDAGGALQATVDLVDVNSTTTEATLMAATWTNNYTIVAGISGTWVLGVLSNYFYLCVATNTWIRIPAHINYSELFIGTVDDSAGIKTNTWLLAQYPTAIVGQFLKGTKSLYMFALSNTWVYWLSGMPEKQQYGEVTFSGDSVETEFDVVFDLTQDVTPTSITITPMSEDAAGQYYISALSNTGFTIKYLTAPATGTNNITFKFKVNA